MARIGASLSGIERTLLNRLAENNAAATTNSLRIAAGERVLTPSHDISAFVRLSGMQAKLSNVTTAMSNATAASSLLTQTQSVVDEIRTQLEAIETVLRTDEDQSLSDSERSSAQAEIEAAIAEISSLASTTIDGRRMLDGSAAYRVQGRHSDQISRVTVYSNRTGDATITGLVTQAATQAELTYTGSSGLVASGDGGTLTITGYDGSADVTISDDEDLDDVATAINNVSHETGVVAEVSGDDLTFKSVEYGLAATLSVSSDASFTVSGGYGDQTAAGTDMVVNIDGIEYSEAQPAQLTHSEPTGLFSADATVTVTGYLGSESISITSGDSLEDAADAINAEQGSTGVYAYVDGTDLILESKDTGAEAEIEIEVTAGSFSTTNGTTTASGSDKVTPYASIDGNTLSVNENGLRYKIEFAEGYAGSFDTLTVGDGAVDLALSSDVRYRTSFSAPTLLPSQLGGLSGRLTDLMSGGAAGDLGDNTSRALRIIEEALGQLDVAEGRIDGIYNSSISTAKDLLEALETDLEDAIEETDGYDENAESLLLEKNEALATNALSGLAMMNQQRQAVVSLIKQMAGLV